MALGSRGRLRRGCRLRNLHLSSGMRKSNRKMQEGRLKCIWKSSAGEDFIGPGYFFRKERFRSLEMFFSYNDRFFCTFLQAFFYGIFLGYHMIKLTNSFD